MKFDGYDETGPDTQASIRCPNKYYKRLVTFLMPIVLMTIDS